MPKGLDAYDITPPKTIVAGMVLAASEEIFHLDVTREKILYKVVATG